MAQIGDGGTLGGNNKLPLPDKFNGKMELWEEWSWSLKTYVALFKTEAAEVMESAEAARNPITDELLERMERDNARFVDTELVKFSRQLHYLLAQLTTDSAKLVVRGNSELNGFETWRLLASRFSLPRTAQDISLLTKVLEFKFRTDHFEQDYSEWETLKARYEKQTGAPLPDNILVATLLNKTTGALQQHLRLNVRTMDTYSTVRDVITAYYQSRHIANYKSTDPTGPAPMDIGAMWRKGKGKGLHWKGSKGRGKSPFGMKGKGSGKLSPFDKGKGKGGSGKSAPAGMKGKGKERPRCWRCGQHGHVARDCKNVATVYDETQENTEEYEYDEENDWTDWTGAVMYDDWSYGDDYDYYQDPYWTDDSNWWTDGWYDNWTWETYGAPTVPPALSPPQPGPPSTDATSSASFTDGRTATSKQSTAPNVSAVHSTVRVTDIETGETQSHVRTTPVSTGSARSVHKGPGLFGAFIATVAVLNSFGRPQGLPLIPETVSQRFDFPNDACHTDAYRDALSAYHDKCIATVPVPSHEHWILFDSGAAAHCCPTDYAPEYPLLPTGRNPPRLRSVTGKPLNIVGRKLIKYDSDGVTLFVNYYVCDVPFCLVSVARLLLQDYCAVLGKGYMKLVTPQEETIPVTRHGTLLYLTPHMVPYDAEQMTHCEQALEEYMNTLDVDLNAVDIPAVDPGTDAVEQLKTLINAIQPRYYHTDTWQLDEANCTLTRIHKRPRRTKFVPDRSDCPVGIDKMTGIRITTMDFGEGRVENVIEQLDQLENKTERTKEHWKGKTVFRLKPTTPLLRNTSKGPMKTAITEANESERNRTEEIANEELEQMAEAPEPSGSLPFSSEDARTITTRLLALGTCDTEEFTALLLALFQTPDPETGDVRTADHWLHTPMAWIRFHHTARRELFVPDETGPDHTELGHTRTTVFFRTSEDDWDGRTHTDMWRMDDQTEPPLSPPVVWTGVTVFACSEPEVVVEQETHDKAAREAKALPRPNEPTERAQHNLTHLPYRSWCEHCVRAKGKERQSKRNTDRQPVIQVDYSFVTTGNDVQQRTILNATDVQTGLSTSVVVPSKGRLAYSMAELKKFIYETGRTFGILQYDKEPSLKALVTDTVKELGGMSVRATPRDWKQAHGSIGKMQQTLFGQARTLRLQLQDRLGMEITSNNCIFPWIIKHSQFLLNRYMTHEDGQTSYFRRWKKDYQTGLCEFGETVLFRMPGKLKDKADAAWHEGIWLGKDTEADESLVFGNGTMHKVRTVRRVVPSKQWNKKLHQALNVTPWDPKGKDTTDTTFVLPPTLGVAGRIREPPGLELPDTEQAPEAEEKSETDGYSPSTPRDDAESLKSLPRETDVRHPPTERTPNPKRSASDELSDEDTQEHKRLTVGALFDITAFTACVASVTVGDTEVPVSRNEDTEELTRELALTEPCLNHVEPEFTEEEVKDGMKLEMNSMKGFEVYDEIPIENCSQDDIDNALDCTWVKRRKTPRKVRCRLVARGCFQEAMDTDDTFASTPTLVTLRVLLLLSLSRCWTVLTCDISTAFLHAPMTERLFMKPPVEFYPDNNCLWLLKRAMYGLKQAPALWQTHFAKTMISLGFHRCKTDPNLYVHSSKELYVLCYVDDLLVCGNPDRIKPFTEQLSKEVLLKIEGELKPQTSVNFLGRTLKHNGDSIDITMSPAYVSDMLTLFGMDTAKPSPTTGTSAKPSHVPQPLNTSEHKAYRAIVGKLLWLALIRPDISYATKELSRDLTAPTTESVTKVKHLLRYISGTRDHCQRLNPSVTLSDSDCTLDIDCYVDSDWAGCKTIRKSTSGTVVQLLNSTVSFGSRTQGTIALSSGEAELYAIGQGTSEALFVKNLIIEAKMAKSVNITVHTDSTAGKSMATRFGTSKKTKHVELRFLYVQELVAKGILKLKKIGTKDNCADVLTKYLSSELLLSHLKKLCVFGFSNRFQL